MKSSREQFEEWFIETWPDRDMDAHRDGHKLASWLAWQASRAEIEIDLPPKEDPANFFCEIYDCDMVHESLANCGLKVKL